MKDLKEYFKIGSTKPYAWAILFTLQTIFSMWNGLIFQAITSIFAILGLVQLGFNLVRLVKQKPKFNPKKVVINVILVLILSAFSNFTRFGHL